MIYSQQVWPSKGGCKLCIFCLQAMITGHLQDPQIGEVGMASSESSATSVLDPKP